MTWKKSIDTGLMHPELVRVLNKTMEILAAEHTPFKVYSGLRTFAQQDELYAQGRTKGTPGAIVTKAKGGQSMHNFGLAADMAPYNMQTDDTDDLWWPPLDSRDGKIWYALEEALQEAAKSIDIQGDLDFEWGGRWKFQDVPHVQLRTTFVELNAGHFPYCHDLAWLEKMHADVLWGTDWVTRRTQFLLDMRSYDVGPVDGDFGPRSVAAMNKFQEDQNLGATDVLTQRTVIELVRLHQTGMSLPRGTAPEDV